MNFAPPRGAAFPPAGGAPIANPFGTGALHPPQAVAWGASFLAPGGGHPGFAPNTAAANTAAAAQRGGNQAPPPFGVTGNVALPRSQMQFGLQSMPPTRVTAQAAAAANSAAERRAAVAQTGRTGGAPAPTCPFIPPTASAGGAAATTGR